MDAGTLDRRVQFRRATTTNDGLSTVDVWAVYGQPVWARREFLSDGEMWRAQAVQSMAVARFTVRWSGFAATITTRDRIACEGVEYDVTGIKEVGRRAFIEITASRLD